VPKAQKLLEMWKAQGMGLSTEPKARRLQPGKEEEDSCSC